MDPELKALLEAQAKTFEEFKAANDKMQSEVSKLGPVSREHVSVEEERAGYALACRVAPRGDVELEVTGKMQKPFFKGCAYASAPISTEQ